MRSFIAFVLLISIAHADFKGTAIRVLDGDTFVVAVKSNGMVAQYKVRLESVDAPEKAQPWGLESKAFLSSLILNKPVVVISKVTDIYGRYIGTVSRGNIRINRKMVVTGNAWWYEHFDPKNKTLKEAQTTATTKKLGLWSLTNPIAPWDWRKDH